jgi:hypothetical protein
VGKSHNYVLDEKLTAKENPRSTTHHSRKPPRRLLSPIKNNKAVFSGSQAPNQHKTASVPPHIHSATMAELMFGLSQTKKKK